MGLVHALASCMDCGKEWSDLNAQGVGAKHHYSTGHQVITEACYSKTFLRAGEDPYATPPPAVGPEGAEA